MHTYPQELDHLIYAAPDLQAGIDAVAELTGVTAVLGGKHPGRGTHNALVSLGEKMYLEILAPDPEQDAASRALPFDPETFARPRLTTWAMATSNIDELMASARATGYDPGVLVQGSRALPDGGRIEWKAAFNPTAPGDGLVPFVIDWQGGPHPSETSPKGLEIKAMYARHPEPAAIKPCLESLGVELELAEGPYPQLVAMLDTPRGSVELT